MVLQPFIQQLEAAGPLSSAQVQEAVADLVDERVTAETKAEFLTALARKGETTDEIALFASELRAKAVHPPLDEATRSAGVLDVCGTGGDRLQTFNISTTVALIAAAAGLPVAKHGNRAITSRAGSADVLEELGIPIHLTPEQAARSLREHRFAFFFAPDYHPAFRQIGPARRLCADRGQRTIFNFLGPLLNPAQPAAQLVGVPRPELCEPVARVLQRLGLRRGMAVSGSVPAGRTGPDHSADAADRHLDELSTLGENTIAEFYQECGFNLSSLSPQHFPIQPVALADVAGGDRQVNAAIVRALVRGDERGPKRDLVLLNAGAALLVGGLARSIAQGWELAAELLDSGRVNAKLEELRSA